MSDGDPEDWPAHPAELRQLERALRCQICQELYQGPVALKCGHTFCSFCIRSSLTSFIKDGRSAACPTCREPTDQADLRPVTHLRDACAAWKAVRQLLLQQHLQAVQQVQQQESSKQQQQHVRRNCHQQTQAMRPTPPTEAQPRHASGGSRVRRAVSAPEVTLSSDSTQESDGCEIDQSGEAESSSDDKADNSDPDWSSEDADNKQQQQHTDNLTRAVSKQSMRTSTPNNNKRKGGLSSSSGGQTAAEDSDVVVADSEDDFGPVEEPAVKRLRTAQQARPGTKQHNKLAPQVDASIDKPTEAPQQQRPEQQQQQAGYVLCPICSSSVRQSFINTHIDDCLARADAEPKVRRIQQQQPSAGGMPVLANKSRSQPAAAPQAPSSLDAAAVAGGSGHGAAGAPKASAASGTSVHRKGKVLEPPPKLCFELLKDKTLKAKLTGLGLSIEGSRKACTDRYTAFRNFVLSLKDSGSSLNLKEAAAEFTKQQRKVARAASRPQTLTARAGAAGGSSGAAAAAGATGNATLSSKGLRTGDGRDDWENLGEIDNSYETLIRQTRERLAKSRQQSKEQALNDESEHQNGQLQQEYKQLEEPAVVEAGAADLPSDTDQGDKQAAATAEQGSPMQLEVAEPLVQQQIEKQQHLMLGRNGLIEGNDVQQPDTLVRDAKSGQEECHRDNKQQALPGSAAVVDGTLLVKHSTAPGSQPVLVTESDEF